MIGFGAALRFNLFFDKRCYTNMLIISYIQVSNTITIIGLITESTMKLMK